MTNFEKKQKYLLDKVDKSWEFFFNSFGWEKVFNIIKEVEKEEFFPKKDEVFRIFREIPLDKVKVVILGQDPYHQKGVADGLAFSTKNLVTPPSLKNIFFEMEKDLGVRYIKNDLSYLLKQGVFLLNTCLTVKPNSPFSHEKEWKEFSKYLVSYLDKNNEDLVWVLWGRSAKFFKIECNIKSKMIVESAHPSPFSAKFGFFGSKPFSKVNEFLKMKGLTQVKWTELL